MIKIKNWWFLDNDPNRKDYADASWGEVPFNQAMIDEIEKYFQSKSRIHAIDVGANIGFMTAYFGSKWKTVTAFEPTPTIFKCLKENCKKQNIILQNLAVSDVEGELLFAINGKSEINQVISDKKYLKKHWSSLTVPSITLDSLNIKNVDIIKIDVEGHELSVIKGAEQLIKKNKPLIVIEISFENKILDKEISYNHSYALNLLESWGYKRIWNHKYDWILEYENY